MMQQRASRRWHRGSQAGPRHAAGLCACLGLALSHGGCGDRGKVAPIADGPTAEQLVSYYSPSRIEILPHSRPRSFDEDLIPDGLKVWLRPLDSAGDSVKAYGVYRFELYHYRPATTDRRGELIQQWTQPILDPSAQQRYWNKFANACEFHLSWEGAPLPTDRKYILKAIFEAPSSNRLFDEHEFEFRLDTEAIRESLQPSSGN